MEEGTYQEKFLLKNDVNENVLSQKVHMLFYYTVFFCLFTENAIRKGLDVIVGTPGRMLDFLEKGTLNLSLLDHVVLDEVDQMLDMGFSESVEKILKFAYKEGKFLPCLTLKY